MDLIEEAEPYVGAGNPLWRLHQLDIEDKHKLLVSVGMSHASTTTRYTAEQLFAAAPEGGTVSFDDMSPRAIGIITPQERFPLEDGAVIYRIPASVRDHPIAQMHMNPEFEFEVAFGEVEVVKGQPLIPTLLQFIQFVERFLKLFPPLFSQEAPPDISPSEDENTL